MSARRRKQGPCWEQLPASVLGQVARHLRRPGRTAGTETICQVCSTWSQAANHLDQDVVLDLVVGSDSFRTSVEDWLCCYAYCLKSLRLALDPTASCWEFARHRLQALHDPMSGLHSAAVAAAAAKAPLRLTHLTLRGEMALYTQLGGLLAALPHLQVLQLTSDLKSYTSEVAAAAENGSLQQQLRTGLAGLRALRALRIDPYLPGFGAAGLRGVLPPSLTALTLVVDDGIGSGELGHLVSLQKLHITDPCEHLGPQRRVGRSAGVLEDVRSIAALPALQQVTVGERRLSWAAMQRLLPKLVALTALQSYLAPEVMHADCTRQLTAMTALELRLSSGALGQGLELDSITGLRRLRLELPEYPALVEGVLQQAGRLTQLEDLCVDLTTEDMEMGMAFHSVHLPASLTGFHLRVSWTTELEEFKLPTQEVWRKALPQLRQVHSLTIPQTMLLVEQPVLTTLTALSSLTLVLGRTGHQQRWVPEGAAALYAGAVEQVAAIGNQLQELVVVGGRPSRMVGSLLARQLPATCKVQQLEEPAQ